MAIQRATDEANIRQRINRCVEALRTMDLEGVMSLYAPDIVSFDLVPPLRHVGAKAKEKNWANAFAMFQCPLGYEIRDLTLTLGDDVAFGHSLNRTVPRRGRLASARPPARPRRLGLRQPDPLTAAGAAPEGQRLALPIAA